MLKQKTLKNSFSLSGKGLHTGLNLTVTFLPAEKKHGYKIQRVDMQGQPILDAVAENVVDTRRGTVLGKGSFKCSTIEHAMAALYALGVDNVLIQVDGPEFPILDGSAEPYVKEILRVGTIEQDAEKDFYYITKKMEFKDENTGACITLLPDEEFSITSMISFDGQFLNSQFATLDNIDDFATEIAAARTFVFVREIEPLLTAGLIKGGDLNNAIVIYEQQTSQENLDKLCKLTGAEHHDAAELGYLQHKKLVWDNEPARHKLLDIIGDMALIGKPLKGRIIATKPGHTINNKFARMMRKEIRKHEIQAPKYDPNKPAIMDASKIRQLLPHRFPMLLVDKVIEMKEDTIVAIKNITSDEPFFQGHFPSEPVMPGVLIIEAMAQAGGILVINSLQDGADYSTYFIRIDNVKFKQKVIPGDTLIFKVETLGTLRHNIGSMQGYAFIGENCVAEATFTAQVIKNKQE
ncbi:MAG: bifunctional UDP-3-O-[3-hydroxymyristoyl] N-acetylglucosamine deacetylase/3-hydroxyacyl-ACP dehydratase [Bacteroidaceae bacterium]|nr:bifunctional UDP-3-O-[3-hydroxymyristoyl] N-acetylglucosamine deacetylase/3-hydroxyacyl-ACP dehydratase [Bacteroidaceae bacterium]